MTLNTRRYVSPFQFDLLKKYKLEGSLAKKELTTPLWLTQGQAKELGYNQGESDFELTPAEVEAGNVYGKIAQTPIEQPKVIAPEAGGNLRNLLLRLYSDKIPGALSTGTKVEGLQDYLLKDIQTQMAADPERFVQDLASKRMPGETRALLDYLNVPADLTDQIVGVQETEIQVFQTLNRIPEFGGIDVEELANLIETKPEDFYKNILTGGITQEKKNLLTMIGYTEADINQLQTLVPQPIQPIKLAPAIPTKAPMITTPAGKQVPYPMTDKEWASMSPAERVYYQAKPQEWLKERDDWAKFRVLDDRIKIVAESLGFTATAETTQDQLLNTINLALWLVPIPAEKLLKLGWQAGKRILPKTAKAAVEVLEETIARIAKADVGVLVKGSKGKVSPKVAEDIKKVAQETLDDVKKAKPEPVKVAGEPVTAEVPKEGIPTMVTRDMETRLRAQGLTDVEINKMTPQQAVDRLKVTPVTPEVTRAIPKAEAGMPEAGLQAAAFGVPEKEVFPKGKGKITQISMDDQLALEQYQRDAKAEGLKEFLGTDPVTSFKFKMGGKNVGLDSLISIRDQNFPEHLTVKQAQAVRPDKSWVKYTEKGTKQYNKVPTDEVFDSIASELGFTGTSAVEDLGNRVIQIRKERAIIRELSRPVTADDIIIEQAEPFQEAVSQGIPPSKAPPPAAQTITTPTSLPEPARDSEIKRIITQSNEQIRQDRPRLLTTLIHKVPGAKQLLEYIRPGLRMTDNPEVLTAMVAEQQARAGVHAWATATQIKMVNDLRSVWGNDVLHGGVSKVKFLGTAEQAKNRITGTLLDMAQNPELYDLSEHQLVSLVNINIHNDQMLDWVVSNFGAEIGYWAPKPNGAYLPNVDIGDDVIQYLQSETRAVSQGRGKTRMWDTARDRMGGKTAFEPELDVQKLLEGLDNFKANAAAGNTYKTAIGGLTRLEAMETTHPELFTKMTAFRKELNSLKGSAGTIESNIHTAIDDFLKSPVEDADLLNFKDTLDVRLKAGKRKGLDMTAIQDRITAVQDQIDEIRPAWQVANLKPYIFVQEGLYRYFPTDKAKLIIESRAVSNNRLIGLIEKWRAGAFSGDGSPFSNQGVLGILADPAGSLKVAGGGIKSAVEHQDLLRSFRVSALADDIANDPVLWAQYAELAGRGLISATPAEYATGWLSKIPKAGKVIDKFNEATYVTVTRGSFNLWKREFTQLMKAGVSEIEAKVAAMRSASEVYPLLNPKLLGQSEATVKLLRSLPTSISFLTKPAELIVEGSRGLAKLASFQKLSPAESSAAKLLVTMAVSILTVSAVSAYASAKALGKDDDEAWQEALNAINPHPMNGKFASIIIGNIRIPLGGPYRAIFRAMYPAQVKGIPFPVPFAGIPNFFRNRINPAIRTQLDMAPAIIGKPEAAVDYNKVQIFNTKDGNVFENILRGLEYEFENILPLSLGTIAEALRQGEKYREPLWQQVIGQFVGVNPVTLDNTYIDRQIKQLGLEKQGEAKPFTIQKPEVYDTKDLYSDVSSLLKRRTGEGFKDKPITLAILSAMAAKDTSDSFLNVKLASLSDNQWLLLQQRQDLTDTTEFDKTNPLLSRVSQRDYLLLREYKSLTDKKAQAQFLKDHPELSLNPRQDWLKSHPKENAQLALFGQAKVLTKEAYNEVLRLAKALDIPDSAIPDLQIPKDSVDNYFKYQDMVADDKNSSWEAQLMLAKDTKLREFLGLKPIETPLASLEIKATPEYHGIWNKLKKEDDPDWVGNLDDKIKDNDGLTARDRTSAELKATKIGDMTWIDLDRKVEAIEKGTDESPIPDELVTSYVKHYQIVDQTSGNSAEAKLNRYGNPELNDFMMNEDYWGKQKAEPLDEDKFYLDNYLAPRWRIEVDEDYKKKDTEYNAIKNPIEAEQDRLRAEWLAKPENSEYRKNKRRKEAYELNNTITGVRLPIDQVENYVAFNEIPQKGKRQERFVVENTNFAMAMFAINGKDIYKTRPEDVPNVAYDDIYDRYKDKFDLIDSYKEPTLPGGTENPDYKDNTVKDANGLTARERAVKALRFSPDGIYTDFGLAELHRKAYGKMVPDEQVGNYVGYYTIVGQGKPPNWQTHTGQDLPWYEDDWFLAEHQDFYQQVYLGILGNERKDFRKLPPREVFAKYLNYENMPSGKLRQDYRFKNPDLEEWLLLTGKVITPITEQKRRAELTPRERTLEEIYAMDTEFDKRMAKLRAGR